MKIFLDDVRNPNACVQYMFKLIEKKAYVYLHKDWEIVRDYKEFVDLVEKNIGSIDLISFDHDLASEHYHPSMLKSEEEYNSQYVSFREKTGYDAAIWFKDLYKKHNLKLPEILIHTMNPVGFKNITNLFTK